MNYEDKATLNAAANPECLDCDGKGFYSVTARNADGYEDVTCDCVKVSDSGAPLPYEPPEPPEPDGEDFRGGEAAGYLTEQMAGWQRLK